MTHRIPAHVPSVVYFAETLERHLTQRSEIAAMIGRNPKVSGVLLGRFLEATAIAEILGKPHGTALACLESALDAGVAAFQLAGAKEPVTVSIDGQQLTLPPTGATDSTHPATWLELFGLTLALRRTAATDAICAFDVNVLRGSAAKVDEFRYSVVVAMQEFWRAGDWRTTAGHAYERSLPQFTRVGGREYVDVEITALKMLEPLEARDAAAFEGALVAALEAHKRYWSSKRWAGHPGGLIAVVPLGLAALAHDRGLAVDVESGYMPAWLLRGEFGE